MQDFFMKQAIKEAKKAFKKNEVPVGCVLVQNDKIISKAYNIRNTKKNALYHAEVLAINKACKIIGDWRLEDCTLYVTIEPCAMCAGAILQSRIKKVVFGAFNLKAGCCGSVLNILDNNFNHKTEIVSGVLEQECEELIKLFFKNLRTNR